MTFQYALRFESGERRGEVIPLPIAAGRSGDQADAPGGVFTIGRQPANSLQVTDASVSGRHAELQVGADGLSIKDLNSTNGTEVAGRRVRQSSLELNDEFTLGKVQFTVVDAATPSGGQELELEMDSPVDPAELSQTQIQPREESFEITAEDIARSRRSSKLAPIGLLALAGLAAGAWFWSRAAGGEGRASSRTVKAAAVEEPAGNLLSAGYSFETSDGWNSIEGDGDRFDLVGSAAASGKRGARAELFDGDYAQLLSDPVSASGSHKVVASVLVDGQARARIGVQWMPASEGSAPGGSALGGSAAGGSGPEGSAGEGAVGRPMSLWSDWQAASEDLVPLELAFTAPPGTGRITVILAGQSTAAAPAPSGSDSEDDDGDDDSAEFALVDFDDVALVPDGASEPLLSEASWRVYSIAHSSGDPARHRALAVSSLDTPMIHGIWLRREAAGRKGGGAADFGVSADAGSVSLLARTAGFLEFRLAQPMIEAGLGTISGAGVDESGGARAATYASHGKAFEALGAEAVLLGSDAKLIKISLPSPRSVVSKPLGAGALVRIEVAEGESIQVEFDFSEDRITAQRLARRARELRSKGASGEALRLYSELLGNYPYDLALNEQSGAAIDEITAVGRQELKALSAEVERARFFGLGDLYRAKLRRVKALQTRYEGTSVAPACAALAREIEAELAKLGSGAAEDEAKRLEAVASALRGQGSEGLAARVEQYMTKTKALESGDEEGDQEGHQNGDLPTDAVTEPGASGGQR